MLPRRSGGASPGPMLSDPRRGLGTWQSELPAFRTAFLFLSGFCLLLTLRVTGALTLRSSSSVPSSAKTPTPPSPAADPVAARLFAEPAVARLLANPRAVRILEDPAAASLLSDPKTVRFLTDPNAARILAEPSRSLEDIGRMHDDPPPTISASMPCPPQAPAVAPSALVEPEVARTQGSALKSLVRKVQPDWPAIYWINAHFLATRKRDMIAMFNALKIKNNTRIAAETPDIVKEKLRAEQLTVNCTLIDKCKEECWWHRIRGEYTYKEVALSMSHFKAIRTAFEEGRELALITEDDVELFEEFPQHLADVLSMAPQGWQVLQFSVKSLPLVEQFTHVVDPFVQWGREHWGTAAYVINRNGMVHLLNKFSPASGIYKFPESPVSDWLIYSSSATYTCTRFLTSLRRSNSSLQNSKDEAAEPAIRAVIREHRTKFTRPAQVRASELSLLVLTTLAGGDSTPENIHKNAMQLSANMRTLKPFGAQWRVFVVLHGTIHTTGAQKTLWEYLFGQYPEIASPEFVKVRVRAAPGLFSKWVYYKETIAGMWRYKYVIICDSDMNFVGFPWHEFFARREAYGDDSVISGAVRRSIYPVLHPADEPRDSYFKYLGGKFWQECNRSRHTHLEVDILEQWFTMLDGAFATWLFPKLFEKVHSVLMQTYSAETCPDMVSDWGPDLVWCRAAGDFRQGGRCVLYPLTMMHMDTGTITKVHTGWQQVGDILKQTYKKLFPQWFIRPHVIPLFGDEECRWWRDSCEDIPFYAVDGHGLEFPSCYHPQ